MKTSAIAFLTGILLFGTQAPFVASGSDAVAPAESRDGRSVPKQAKVITEAELKTELVGHKGRVTILHFWATWCEPCLTELPFIARLAQEWKRKGIDFVPVSLDSPSEKSVRHVSEVLAQRVRDVHWSRVLKLSDASAFMSSVDPRWEGVIPAFFAYDQESKLRRSFVGNIDQSEFDKLISGLVYPGKK